MNKPIGVATYEIVKGQLPSPEQTAKILEAGV